LKGSPADLPLADGDTLRIPARTPGAPVRARAGPAAGEPFAGPNNFGVTGLFETPTARMMPENRYRLGATQVHPYRYYFGTVGLFDRLEVNGRITEILGVKAFKNLPGSGYGNDKDKAVDAKLLLFKEGTFLPAIAVAISAIFVAVIALTTHVRFADIIVAYAPGAMDAMLALALTLHIDPIFVGAHHLSRFVFVTIATPGIIHLFGRPQEDVDD